MQIFIIAVLFIGHATSYDLVLSSGFLAFGRQVGFLDAIEKSKIPIDRIIGTSSGSLAGSLYAAGYSTDKIAKELGCKRPIQYVRPTLQFYKGAFSLKGMIKHLRTLLPADFADLKTPFAVGVFDSETGTPKLITDGDLPAAVAASCAIPYIFRPVLAGVPTRLYADGGVKDRVFVRDWSVWAGAQEGSPRHALVHLVDTSLKTRKTNINGITPAGRGPRDAVAAPPHTSLFIVRTPRANASFFSLKDYDQQLSVASDITTERLNSADFEAFSRLRNSSPDIQGTDEEPHECRTGLVFDI